MSDQKAVVFREFDSGFNISAYFLAISLMSTLEYGIIMVFAGSISFWLRSPLMPYASYVLNFFLLQFCFVAWGHLITAFVPPDNLAVIVGTILLSSGLLCSGFIRPLLMADVYSSKTAALLSGLISPVRYFVETMVVSDRLCLGGQYGFTTDASKIGTVPETVFDALHLAMNDKTSTRLGDCRNGWHYGKLRLLFTSLMVRALTLLVIQWSYRRQSISTFQSHCKRWFLLQLVIFLGLCYSSVWLILN